MPPQSLTGKNKQKIVSLTKRALKAKIKCVENRNRLAKAQEDFNASMKALLDFRKSNGLI